LNGVTYFNSQDRVNCSGCVLWRPRWCRMSNSDKTLQSC